MCIACLCMSVCVCDRVHMFVYGCVCTCVCVHVHTCLCIHAYMWMRVCAYMMCIHTHVCVCVCVCVCKSINSVTYGHGIGYDRSLYRYYPCAARVFTFRYRQNSITFPCTTTVINKSFMKFEAMVIDRSNGNRSYYSYTNFKPINTTNMWSLQQVTNIKQSNYIFVLTTCSDLPVKVSLNSQRTSRSYRYAKFKTTTRMQIAHKDYCRFRSGHTILINHT